jgi:hypothetical protein
MVLLIGMGAAMTAASLATPAGVRVRTGRFGVAARKGFLRTPSTDTHLISLPTQLVQFGCRTCRMSGDWLSSQTTSEHHVTEHAVIPSEIEQLPDLSGFLKLASSPSWRRVNVTRQ